MIMSLALLLEKRCMNVVRVPLNAVFLVNPRTIPFNGLRICLELGPSVDVVCFGLASKVRRGDTDLWIMPNPFHLTSTVISVHVDDAVLS